MKIIDCMVWIQKTGIIFHTYTRVRLNIELATPE